MDDTTQEHKTYYTHMYTCLLCFCTGVSAAVLSSTKPQRGSYRGRHPTTLGTSLWRRSACPKPVGITTPLSSHSSSERTTAFELSLSSSLITACPRPHVYKAPSSCPQGQAFNQAALGLAQRSCLVTRQHNDRVRMCIQQRTHSECAGMRRPGSSSDYTTAKERVAVYPRWHEKRLDITVSQNAMLPSAPVCSLQCSSGATACSCTRQEGVLCCALVLVSRVHMRVPCVCTLACPRARTLDSELGRVRRKRIRTHRTLGQAGAHG
jgi:hypothetical protein